jgi:hypothetical protein
MFACCAAVIVLSVSAPFARVEGPDAPARATHRVEVSVPRIVSTRMVDRGDGVLQLELRTNDPGLRAKLGRPGIPEQWTTRTSDGRKVITVRQTFVAP